MIPVDHQVGLDGKNVNFLHPLEDHASLIKWSSEICSKNKKIEVCMNLEICYDLLQNFLQLERS